MLNAEAYMLFYKKGVALAKLTHDDDNLLHPLSASSECDSHLFSVFWGVFYLG